MDREAKGIIQSSWFWFALVFLIGFWTGVIAFCVWVHNYVK